jgi:hypothetical protein
MLLSLFRVRLQNSRQKSGIVKTIQTIAQKEGVLPD